MKYFQAFIDIAFHASLMTEEKRRPGFRLLYCSPEDLKSTELLGLPYSFRTITMPEPRPFTVSELNHIAPAADLTRFLICVCPKKKKSTSLRIWGLLDMGDTWWKFVHNEEEGGMVPPNFLTIASAAPGELSLSVQGTILLMLKDGKIFHSYNPIWSGPISKFLDLSRQRLYDQTIQELKIDKWDDEEHDDDYPKNFYNFFLERLLYNTRYLDTATISGS